MGGHKVFYTAADIAAGRSISEGEAEGLVRKLHKALKGAGKILAAGKVPAAWYEKQREKGFMEAEPLPEQQETRRLIPAGRSLDFLWKRYIVTRM